MERKTATQPCEAGRSMPRLDAYAKVTGKTRYAADFYAGDMVWAGVKRGGVPHATILSVETEEARAVEGVIAVLTAEDVTGTNRQGVVRKDQPVLADQRIRHRGDPVALVVAESREAIRAAVERIRVHLEPLPGLFDPDTALDDEAVRIHENHPGGNVLLEGTLETGGGEDAFAQCDAVVEAEFQVPMQEHSYLETEAGWAVLEGDGVLKIEASTQTPFRDRSEVAEAIGLPVDRVRVIAPYCGGAFGGKDGVTIQSLLGLAAMRVPGRPVKIWLDREESFLAGVKRHPARLRFRLGAKADGTLHALSADLDYDTGPYDHLGGVVTALGLEHAGGPYRIPNTRVRARSVYTNNPVGGAFRGFGVPQAAAGVEQVIDMLASRLGLSPVTIRLKNVVRRGDRNAIGVAMLHSTGIHECLEVLESHSSWRDRQAWKGRAPGGHRRGVGVACVMHAVGYGPKVPDVANAKIELTPEGTFRVYCGVVDMGQGNITTYLQIAGHVLNQDLTAMEPVLPDTDQTLPSGSASASRTTFTFGNALIRACELLKRRILERTADLLMEEDPGNLDLVPGEVIHLTSGKRIPLSQIALILNREERFAVARYRAPVSRERPTDREDLRLHGIPHTVFSFGAHLAAVEVDELTGRIAVKKYLVASDCGRLINPRLFEQQVHGGVAQGLGYGLIEDMVVRDGKIMTGDFSTYIIPTAMDVPHMVSLAVQMEEKSGPFGLKGAGEVAVDAPLPAVANAVADACGVRVTRFPMTPERIMEQLERSGEPAP
ncbi:MAG: xanthine dehydrogenase family protein [Deltaproteobacteria bacterium]|nr:xanthine dehydrogenase family protein [Deltaproteobacteria bacterium]MBW2111526.1 xanthine dehydrogenase family protein [Deltaproteobacteria bacterium]